MPSSTLTDGYHHSEAAKHLHEKHGVVKVWKMPGLSERSVVFASKEVATSFAAAFARRFLTEMWEKRTRVMGKDGRWHNSKGRSEFFANARQDARRSAEKREWQVQLPEAERFDELFKAARASDSDADWIAAAMYADKKDFEGETFWHLHFHEMHTIDVCDADDVKELIEKL